MKGLGFLPLFVSASVTVASAADYNLSADGVTDTYRLISEAGYFAETEGGQTPDEFMCHGDVRHISQIFDNNLQQHVFAFDIHIDYALNGVKVTDGNKGELVDRQRNEIKCMSDVPGTVAQAGETITYKWKFRLPEGMRTTSEFCHVHQIKGMGSSDAVAHQVITLTCRSTSSGQQLQVINVPYEGAANVYLAQIDLSKVIGRWVQASETFTVGHHGNYRLTLADAVTGDTILSVNKDDIEIWRETDDDSTMRAKWGIYRSLGANLALKGQLKSERVLFADFQTIKGTDAIDDIFEDKVQDDGLYYDLMGRPVLYPSRGIYIRNGKKYLFP